VGSRGRKRGYVAVVEGEVGNPYGNGDVAEVTLKRVEDFTGGNDVVVPKGKSGDVVGKLVQTALTDVFVLPVVEHCLEVTALVVSLAHVVSEAFVGTELVFEACQVKRIKGDGGVTVEDVARIRVEPVEGGSATKNEEPGVGEALAGIGHKQDLAEEGADGISEEVDG